MPEKDTYRLFEILSSLLGTKYHDAMEEMCDLLVLENGSRSSSSSTGAENYLDSKIATQKKMIEFSDRTRQVYAICIKESHIKIVNLIHVE